MRSTSAGYNARSMKIATWNVNSVKARKERLIAWLARHQPDVLCLQELKTQDAGFPHAEVNAAGYRAATHGQKTYNGVAILAKTEPADVQIGLGDDVDDPEARCIAATVDGVRVMSLYVPNGQRPDSDKFVYKLAWLQRFEAYLQAQCRPDTPLAVCGDLNIAPDDLDAARPAEWNGTVLCVPQVREAFQRLLSWGLTDTLRLHHPEGGVYSWWDYRMLGFQKNNGLRIDHILATDALATRCRAATVDRDERKGVKPSDHAPVIAEFDEPPASDG